MASSRARRDWVRQPDNSENDGRKKGGIRRVREIPASCQASRTHRKRVTSREPRGKAFKGIWVNFNISVSY